MKDYKRLTEKGSDIFLCGEFHYKYTTAKENIIQYDTNETYEKPNCCFGGTAIERLADFENKIESGELCEREEIRKETAIEIIEILKSYDEENYLQEVENIIAKKYGVEVEDEQ